MDALLVVNAGSSSLKFRLYRVGAGDAVPCEIAGQLDGIGVRPRLRVRSGTGATMIDRRFAPAEVPDLPAAIAEARG